MNSHITRLGTLAISNRYRRLCASLFIMLAAVAALTFLPALRRAVARSPLPAATRTEDDALNPARLGSRPRVSVTDGGNRTINLSEGREVLTAYDGPEDLRQTLTRNQAQPLSLAAADFDEDGVPDLVSGYARGSGGIVTLRSGNVDSIYPNSPEAQERRSRGAFSDASFLSAARVFGLKTQPTFLGAGDFDGDGHYDLVAASLGGTSFQFLKGDGKGSVYPAQDVEVPGAITAFATGEVNRADGLVDVLVAVERNGGSGILVFEGPAGAIKAVPETIAIPARCNSLIIAQLDHQPGVDIAAAVGRELLVIHGRDRRLSLEADQQATVPAPIKDSRVFPSSIRAVAAGDFKGEHQTSLALLFEDGTVHLLERSAEQIDKKDSQSLIEWRDAELDAGRWAGATALVAARVSGRSQDDLLVVDAVDRRIDLLIGDKLRIAKNQTKRDVQIEASGALIQLEASATPVAVLPMQLNTDALNDLVLLIEDSCNPVVTQTESNNAGEETSPLPTTLAVNGTSPWLTAGRLETSRKKDNAKSAQEKKASQTSRPKTMSSFRPESPEVCSVTPISAGQTLNGTLSAADCSLVTGEFVDTYVFSAVIGQQVAIGMSSTAFDSYLYLIAPNGSLLAVDDDGLSLGGTNSRIPQISGFITLPASGVYTIYASSFDSFVTGDYQVALVGNACQSTAINFGQTINGALSGTDCPLLNGTLGDLYTFAGVAGQEVAMVMVSNDFDPIMYLIAPDGTVVARDDDGSIDRNARIPKGSGFFALPQNGTYTLVASSFSAARTGTYAIQIITNTSGCPTTSISYGQTVSGALAASDCHLADNTFVDTYAFSGRAGQQIALSMSSANFDTFLFLIFPDGTVLLDNNGGGGSNSRIPADSGFITLPASGVYTVLANAFDPFFTGNYTLSLSVAITDTTVTNTNDSGTGSLRQAILNANANPGPNLITFNIGSGLKTINLLSPLPTILETVTIDGTSQPGFAGNPIIELNGTSAGVEAYGLKMIAGNCRVRGLIFNRFSFDGLILSENGSNIIEGNYIGTNAAGTGSLGNLRNGVGIECSNNLIGGTTANARNIISGNHVNGIAVATSTGNQPVGNLIQGNYVGTNALGNSIVGNLGNGIKIQTGSASSIGGTVPGARNIVSGNQYGIALALTDPSGNLIQGNYLGTNVSGTSALANEGAGILVGGIFDNTIVIASHNTIGGTVAAARNLVSGNHGQGVEVDNTGSVQNLVQGNFIGTDVNGTGSLPNTGNGVLVLFAPNNTVGGTAGAGNVIAANGVHGVGIGIPQTNPFTGQVIIGGKGVDVLGNSIGTDISGVSHLGNTVDGVLVAADSVSNRIANNAIAFNHRNGVFIPDFTDGAPPTSIPGYRINMDTNAIYANTSLGIDLGAAGITANDALDADIGANLQQNFPVPLSFGAAKTSGAVVAGKQWFELNGPEVPLSTDALTVTSQLRSTPNTTFTVNWYFSSDSQCLSNQQGSRPLAFGRLPGITTNSNGDATFNFSFDFPPGVSSGVINTTATDPVGNTSEYSGCLPVNSTPPSIKFSSTGYSVSEGGVEATITVSRSGAIGGGSTVDLNTSDGSARQSQDYVVGSGTISFAAGETSKTFGILIVDDAFVEGNETINLVLSNPTGATLAAPTAATLTITDNDTAASTTPAPKRFAAMLDGAQQTPPNISPGKGTGYVLLNQTETAAFVSLQFLGLGSAETSAHIHGSGAPGVAAPILFTLPATNPVTNFQISPTAAQVANLKAGLHYLDVHSSGFGNGELRGQLRWSPTLEENFFVRQQYLDFLSRDGDPGGFNFWLNQISSCQADAQCLHDRTITTSNAFFFEPEFQQTAGYVFRAYRAAYGNNQPFPNPDGTNVTEANKLIDYSAFVADRARVVGGANLALAQQTFANQFVTRAQFANRYAAGLTGPQFVDAILANIQAADAVNLTALRQLLIDQYNNAGGGNAGRAMVLYRLADDNPQNPINNQAFINAEYNRQFALTLYFGYLRRNPDIGGFLFWQGKINLAPVRDVAKQNALVCSFLTAAEYQLRFGPNAARSNAECPQ